MENTQRENYINKEQKSQDIPKEKLIDFLFKEYEAAWNLMTYLHDMQNRWIRFYWLMVVAFFVALFFLSKQEGPGTQLLATKQILFVLTLLILLMGILTFLVLTFLRARQVEQINSVNKVRKFFVEQDEKHKSKIGLREALDFPLGPVDYLKFRGVVFITVLFPALLNSVFFASLFSFGVTQNLSMKLGLTFEPFPFALASIGLIVEHLLIWAAVLKYEGAKKVSTDSLYYVLPREEKQQKT